MEGRFSVVVMAVLGAVTALLSGCSSVTVSRPDRTGQDYSVDEFKAYVEHVFRYQNRVVNELIVYYNAQPLDGPAPDPALVAAEEASVEACQPLNRVVNTFIEGDSPAFGLKQQLVATIGTCEYQVEMLDNALSQVD